MLKNAKDSKNRAARFVPELLATGKVFYCLDKENPEQLFVSTTNDEISADPDESGQPVIPFWTETYLPYARKWDAGPIVDMDAETFIKNCLPRFDLDGVRLGLNWDGDGCGVEVLPEQLLQDERMARALLKENSRVSSFIDELLETDCVYYSVDKDDPGQILMVQAAGAVHVDEDGDPLPVIPFWSKSGFQDAQQWAQGEIVETCKDRFIFQVLPELEMRGILLGVNWNGEGCGDEIRPGDILRDERVAFPDFDDLTEAQKQYMALAMESCKLQ